MLMVTPDQIFFGIAMGSALRPMLSTKTITRFCRWEILNALATLNLFSNFQLVIKSKDSYGEYTCKAKNELGDKEHAINLIEGVKPESPKVFGLRGLSSDTFDIDVGAKIDFKNRHRMDVNGFRFELIPKDIFLENHGSWNRSWVKDFPIAGKF